MGRIVLRFPVELLEKVGANNRQFTRVPREPAAHGVREGKSEDQRSTGGEMVQSAHGGLVAWGRATWRGVRKE